MEYSEASPVYCTWMYLSGELPYGSHSIWPVHCLRSVTMHQVNKVWDVVCYFMLVLHRSPDPGACLLRSPLSVWRCVSRDQWNSRLRMSGRLSRQWCHRKWRHAARMRFRFKDVRFSVSVEVVQLPTTAWHHNSSLRTLSRWSSSTTVNKSIEYWL